MMVRLRLLLFSLVVNYLEILENSRGASQLTPLLP